MQRLSLVVLIIFIFNISQLMAESPVEIQKLSIVNFK